MLYGRFFHNMKLSGWSAPGFSFPFLSGDHSVVVSFFAR